jgi:glycosyltransferase involved in cell wall biosynthesis
MRMSTRAGEAWRVLREDGPRRLAQRVSRVAYQRLRASELDFPLDLDHVADSRDLKLPVPYRRPPRGTPLTVGWICTPPGPGSGGHTTMFRMVEAVEAAGHTCVLYLYDRFGGDLSRHERVIRQYWPRMRAEVRTVADGLVMLDAYVASSWATAHVLARSGLATRRLYFIQDYEPWFYPQGAEYVLAEDTYRFGFRPITVGPMLAGLLRERFGVEASVAPFGCDVDTYRLTNEEDRDGVVFYARSDTPRRGFMLGLLALREFHRRHPAAQIHLFGDPTARVPFPATNHGRVSPAGLSEIYNQCAAGIALSFTNVSLVPDELLACGVVPIVGDNPYARGGLNNPHVRWSASTPSSLADALGAVVAGDRAAPGEVAASVRLRPWHDAQRATVETIEDEVYGPPDLAAVPGAERIDGVARRADPAPSIGS